jgi:hypothetical protein
MGLHTVPEMDRGFYEAADDPHEGYVTEDRAQEMFVAGARAMREMLARFVEQGGDPSGVAQTIAQSMRLNWHPGWGADPGRPAEVVNDPWEE